MTEFVFLWLGRSLASVTGLPMAGLFVYGGSWAKEVGDGSKSRTKKAEILRFGS
jgi:hypothetical protein